MAGQDESVDLARPAPLCLLGCQWQVTLFKQWGRSNFRGPQFVSGGWDNRGMRLKLASAIVVIGLFASSVAPANAIFGFSKCEKVKKQILSEEKISIILYNLAKKYRDSAIKDNSATWGDYSAVLSQEILGRQSDIKVFNMMIKNSSCFSAEINANIRIYKQGSQEWIKSSQKSIQGISEKSWYFVVDTIPLNALKSFNWKFTSVYDKDFLNKMNA